MISLPGAGPDEAEVLQLLHHAGKLGLLQLVLPPNWWELFDAAKDDMDAVCEQALTGFALGSPAAPAL